ncbi:hypothetical protein [Gillisia sp. Hel_I_29]|uniref:hypothetical protein n=1 Tax=Gillisia sp. Hel_I_29 TaxID=1249975 RepID=UPI0006921961|nr:hypothetical protein [Gillisia sp. Hel_I_29]
MGHPTIYFRLEELQRLQNQYAEQKIIVDNQIENFLSNVNNKQELYNEISKLENSQEYFNGFKNTAIAIENLGANSVLNNRSLYVDPFSYTNFGGFDITDPETTFHFAIGLGVIFLLLLFTKFKDFRNIVFLLLIGFIGWNLYNYQVKEPEYLAQIEESLNLEDYREMEFGRKASEKFVEYYRPISNYTYEKTYSYEVEGYDENYNDFYGSVETSGKFGNGYLIDVYGNEIVIETEWINKGEMIGTDENGNEFQLRVAH